MKPLWRDMLAAKAKTRGAGNDYGAMLRVVAERVEINMIGDNSEDISSELREEALRAEAGE